MSDLNIALVLKLVDRATAPARAAMKQIEGMGRKMEGIGREGLAQQQRLTEGHERRVRGLKGESMELMAMGAAIFAATEPAVRFEEQMAQVRKVIDFKAPDGFRQLRNDLFDLNTVGGLDLDASEIMKIMEAAGQSNLIDAMLPDEEKRRQLIAFTKDAGIMAVAFDMQAGAAGKAMTTWRNQLKLNQNEALLMGDAVNHLSNSMDAEASAIVTVISRSAALAKTRGLNAIEIAALSAAFVLAAPSPEIAATAMKKFTGVLTVGAGATDQQSAALKRLGFNTTDMAKRMQGDAQGAIMDVMMALSDLPIEEQGAALKQLFGEESIGAIAPLLANTDLLKRAFGLVSKETQYAGAMTKEFMQITETTAYQRGLLGHNLHKMSVIIGSELLPIMNDLMAVAMPIISQITDWIAANPELVKTIGYVVAGLFAMKASSLAVRWTFEALTLGFIRFDRILSWGVLGLGKLMRGFALLRFARPLKWARLIPRIKWLRLAGGALKWALLITPLKWTSKLIPKIGWKKMVRWLGKFHWRLLITPLVWFAKTVGRAFIGPIGWAMLAASIGMFAWNILGLNKLPWADWIDAIPWENWFSFEWHKLLPEWDWSKIIPPLKIGDIFRAPDIHERGNPYDYSKPDVSLVPPRRRAIGGPVRAGLLYEINERGQEFFSPDRDGHVIPAGKIKTGGGRGGSSLSIGDINITAAPGMSPMDVARAVRREIERMADAASSALHDGGAYAD
ncbi:phage tail tape measure protein [Profundibacter sp.]